MPTGKVEWIEDNQFDIVIRHKGKQGWQFTLYHDPAVKSVEALTDDARKNFAPELAEFIHAWASAKT
jgi:hypothetical protein